MRRLILKTRRRFPPIWRLERRRLRRARRRRRGRSHHEVSRRARERRGCGHWPLGSTRTARPRTATRRPARPRWRRSPRVGGGPVDRGRAVQGVVPRDVALFARVHLW
jgi:hypothetical protein